MSDNTGENRPERPRLEEFADWPDWAVSSVARYALDREAECVRLEEALEQAIEQQVILRSRYRLLENRTRKETMPEANGQTEYDEALRKIKLLQEMVESKEAKIDHLQEINSELLGDIRSLEDQLDFIKKLVHLADSYPRGGSIRENS